MKRKQTESWKLEAMHRWLALACVVALAALGCGEPEPQGPDEGVARLLEQIERIETEASPAAVADGAQPETPTADSFQRLDPGSGLLAFAPPQQEANCPGSIKTFLRRTAGNNCVPGDPNQARAEIGAYSRLCVVDCDPALRLREANAAAAARCQQYCSQFSCGAQYAPRSQCAAQDCFANNILCPDPQCPTFDACYLLQAGAAWNCECVPDVTG
ncbi:MAG: hypothetical protein DWQ36_14400 [Acidobacteria bacterium]|nr:MAG: hypothetical protein DWQ30_23195 [Acidobacteriota bacterium]REK06083.1 MAG: hypothetical protein DWQ36_14400 [Acidobacteriota bacterium]